MRYLLAILLTFLLITPSGYAASFNDLSTERSRLLKLIVTGKATDQETQAFINIDNQIKQITIDTYGAYTTNQIALQSNLEQVNNRTVLILNQLFNNSSIKAPISISNIVKNSKPTSLIGGITYTDNIINEFNKAFDLLVSKVDTSKLDYYNKGLTKAISFNKDVFNYLIPYRGIAYTMEAGDVIEDKVKIRSLSSAEYIQQKEIDNLHSQLTQSIFNLSENPNNFNSLISLIGDQAANSVFNSLIVEDIELPTINWSINTKQDKIRKLIAKAIDTDSSISNILDKVHKYNHRNKATVVASHILMPALGVASLTPTIVGPAAKAALVAWVIATHSIPDVEVLKELYLDRRLESRISMITEEATLAINSYQIAALSNNKSLFTFSKAFIVNMYGDSSIIDEL